MKAVRASLTILSALVTAALLSACAPEKPEVLKSPCVGIDDSPCGPKRPVNGVFNPDAHAHS